MKTKCRHPKSKVTTKTRCWSWCVAKDQCKCSGASHGGVTYVEVCECGAERRTESNGCHHKVGYWVLAENGETNA